jgi:hypothetical protein
MDETGSPSPWVWGPEKGLYRRYDEDTAQWIYSDDSVAPTDKLVNLLTRCCATDSSSMTASSQPRETQYAADSTPRYYLPDTRRRDTLVGGVQLDLNPKLQDEAAHTYDVAGGPEYLSFASTGNSYAPSPGNRRRSDNRADYNQTSWHLIQLLFKAVSRTCGPLMLRCISKTNVSSTWP